MSTTALAVNSITLVGHLTADPILRALEEDRSVCDMRLAVNDQKDHPPLFIDTPSTRAPKRAPNTSLRAVPSPSPDA
jgi:hypothetical protein